MRFIGSLFTTVVISSGLVQVLAVDPPCDPTNALTPPLVCSTRAAFGGSLVVPDVIPSFLPTGVLSLVYGNVNVGGAQQLSPSRLVNPPLLAFNATPGTNSGPKYLLIMVDPDSPSPSPGNTQADVVQWLQTDLTVDPATLALTSSTPAVGSYIGPAPAMNAGIHRFVALLYTQPAGFVAPVLPDTLTGARVGVNLAGIVAASGLGPVVGGQFFKSTFDTLPIPAPSGVAPVAPVSTASSTSSSTHTTTVSNQIITSTTYPASSATQTSSQVQATTTGAQPIGVPGVGGSGSQISAARKTEAGLYVMAVVAGLMGLTLWT